MEIKDTQGFSVGAELLGLVAVLPERNSGGVATRDVAWFSTQAPSAQWGRRWGDTPYEYVAGEPEVGPWHLVAVPMVVSGVHAPCDYPADEYRPLSVAEINIARRRPWLRAVADPSLAVYPGAGLAEFERFIRSFGGSLLLPQPV